MNDMHCLSSSFVPLLTIVLSLSCVGAVAAEGGVCGASDLGFDVDVDGCSGLSLIQRRAHVTYSQHGKAENGASSEASATGKALATVAISAGEAAATAHPAAEFSRLEKSSIYDSAALSLVMLQSADNSVHESKIASANKFMLLVFLPIVAIALGMIVYCVLSASRSTDESSGELKPGQQSLARSGDVPASAASLTQSSLGSAGSLLQLPSPTKLAFSPIQPTVRLPAQQMPRSPACILFPTMAADVRRRNQPFNIYWGTTEAPWFRLECKAGAGDQDRLQLCEVHDGVSTLCASVDLTRGEAVSDGSLHWRVTNQYLQANTRGLAYRTGPELGKESSKVRNSVASWGTTVPGVQIDDDWLKVGDWYLPMRVNNCITITPSSGGVQQSSGMQITRADGMVFATLRMIAVGQWAVMRHGGGVQPMYNIFVGTSNFLLEARLPNGKRVAAVKREQVKLDNDEMMLELCVEPECDPVIMLIGSVAVLRQLPAHQD